MKRIYVLLLAALLLTILLSGCADMAQPTESVSDTQPTTEVTTPPIAFKPVPPVPVPVDYVLTGYDLTGGGKSDTLQIHCLDISEDLSWGTYGYHWQIFINEGVAMEIQTDWPVHPKVELYTVSEGRVYLAICNCLDTNDDIEDFGLYQYQAGKLVKVCDFYSSSLDTAHIFHYGAELLSVTEDNILLRCSNQFNATARLCWDVEFTYADGAWVQQSNVYPVVYEDYMEAKADGMTANQSFPVYTATACDQVAYNAEKGNILTIDSLCIENGEVYFHTINEAGQEGWLKDPEEVYCVIDDEDLFGYFEEAVFAG